MFSKSIKRFLFFILLLCSIIFIFAVKIFNGKIYQDKNITYVTFMKNKQFSFKYIQQLVPAEAEKINYRIYFPGAIFSLSFSLNFDDFINYKEKFDDFYCKKINLPLINDNIISINNIKTGYTFSFTKMINKKNKLNLTGNYDIDREIITINSTGLEETK